MTEAQLTPRRRFIHALERRPPVSGARVPHFELVFFLTMEAFGRVHPHQRLFKQWQQMTERERRLHRLDMARLYVETAERFRHDAIFVHPNPRTTEELAEQLACIRELSGDRFFLMAEGDCTYSMPNGERMMDFSVQMCEEPRTLLDEAERRLERKLAAADRLRGTGLLDGFALCSDYAMNHAPFFSPEQFGRFIAPYLKRVVAAYREMGYYAIKHSDGCLWPILDQIADANPHALHSIDPQGAMDLARVKREYGGRLCLIGNVSCAALDTGSDAEVAAGVRQSLRDGMPGGGYIFSTSNCIYTGMSLERYENLMLDIWAREGVYTPDNM